MIEKALQEALKQAMRSRDKERLSVLRFISAAVKQREVDERISLEDRHLIEIMDKLAKQRGEAIEQAEKANRQDLVQKERYELAIIREFLPQQLAAEEIVELVKQAIQQSQANTIADMGKVMAILKPQIQGRADITKVSELVKAALAR